MHLLLGQPNDAEATADGTIIALLKRLRTLLGLVITPPTAHATGVATAPAAAAVIADTGALAAGSYEIRCQGGHSGVLAAGKHLMFEHRNAANAATLHNHLVPAGMTGDWELPRVTLALNERIRAVIGEAAGEAASVAAADIYVRPTP